MLEAVGKYVKVQIMEQPTMTAGGLHLPEQHRKKTLYGVVKQRFEKEVDGFQYLFEEGDKVFWRESPVGACYMEEDGVKLVFMPPGELFAKGTK